MIPSIRVVSQQLSCPDFENPGDLVAWMGAIQAQDYKMAKWAVGLRLNGASLQTVEEALRRGEILRTHVMRPTWHFVTAENIRWMLKLSAGRIGAAIKSRGRSLGMTEDLYIRGNQLIEKSLEGGRSLTKQGIASELSAGGMDLDTSRIDCILLNAETEGFLCSGVEREGKHTYALLEERVSPAKELTREESLARLALLYFKSHSPAALTDFVWWSGLSLTEARLAMELVRAELLAGQFPMRDLYIHESYSEPPCKDEGLYLLPSYDEYLISYKDRTTVLELCHHSKAFTNNGLFFPVIMHRGKVVGSWKRQAGKGHLAIETSFFRKSDNPGKIRIRASLDKYRKFCGSPAEK